MFHDACYITICMLRVERERMRVQRPEICDGDMANLVYLPGGIIFIFSYSVCRYFSC